MEKTLSNQESLSLLLHYTGNPPPPLSRGIKNATNEVLGYTEDPIVSSDILGTDYASLIDGLSTSVVTVAGRQLVKVVSWYDNEMSYTRQMIRTMKALFEK